MSKKTIKQQRNDYSLLTILSLICILLSNIGIPGIADVRIVPNYFIALFIIFIMSKNCNLHLYKLLTIGLIIDLFVGQILGQYALIFICIFLVDHIVNKILLIKTDKQILSLAFFLILISFFILGATSQSHNIVINFEILFYQLILTFFTFLIFRIIVNNFISK